MWIFIISGILYLVGIAIVLILKPSYMFTPDGHWKEFGIGQREDRYTPFPFWLFCLVWALICYILVLLLSMLFNPTELEEAMDYSKIESVYKNVKANNRRRVASMDTPYEEAVELPKELAKGYYVLNKKASKIAGVPKYVYLGPEEPSDY
jgi:hypothetical protein